MFPLEGLRVLDLSRAVSGPYAGRLLGDLGADVVKVEAPAGDVTSRFGLTIDGISGLFLQMNAGKRGVGIDFARSRGTDLIRRLASRADVVIENFRPGVLDRGKLGYDDLSTDNPRLVMLSVSGFGRTSPDAQRQAYAPVIHAESGLIARQAQLDRTRPADVALALADSVAALHGTVAILAALTLRERTGQGQHIDLSMLDAMLATDEYAHHAIDGSEVHGARGTVLDAPGGPIMIAADAKTLWAGVAGVGGLADPAPEASFARKVEARARAVEAWVAAFPDRAALVDALERAGLAWADVRTTASALESPTAVARQVVGSVGEGEVARGVIKMPYRFSAAECEVRGPAPTCGRDNAVVLREWLGLGDAEFDELVAAGVLSCAGH